MKNRHFISTLTFLLMLLLPTAAFAGNTTVDWGVNTFAGGSPGNIPNGYSRNYATFYSGNAQGERTVSVSITSNNVTGGFITNLEHFSTNHGLVDPTFGSYLRVRQDATAQLSDTYTVVIDFGGDVTDVQFVVSNLHYRPNSDRIHRVTVTANDGATSVNPQLSTAAGTLTIAGQTATSQVDSSALAINIPAGTVVDSITLFFSNADTVDNAPAGVNANMTWRVANISFSPSTPLAVMMSDNQTSASDSVPTILLLAGILTALTAGWVILNRPQEA